MNWWLALGVFATDALISFLGWASLDAWLSGNRARVLAANFLLDLAIAVNTMGFVIDGWVMLAPSLLGSAIGTLAAFGRRE